MLKKYCVLALILMDATAAAYNFKARARENFEWLEFSQDGGESFQHQGLSNTINIWWEKPFDHAVGFALGPVISSLKESDGDSEFGDSLKLFHLGLEYKGWVWDGFFFRTGAYGVVLDGTAEDATHQGSAAMLGVGYEFKIGRTGLAIESDYRKVYLSNSMTADNFLVALGVHFYGAL